MKPSAWMPCSGLSTMLCSIPPLLSSSSSTSSVRPSSFLHLLPINQVNPEQREKFLAKESGKRKDFLHKFVNVRSASQVKVETVLIESDMEGKAILDLIPILNIRILILGATVRRMRSKKGNGAPDLIVHKAPEYCKVKIISEGKEMSELSTTESPSHRQHGLRLPNYHLKCARFGPLHQCQLGKGSSSCLQILCSYAVPVFWCSLTSSRSCTPVPHVHARAPLHAHAPKVKVLTALL